MDAPCVAPSRVTQKIFAVLVEWYHRIVRTMSFKLVSFFYIYKYRTADQPNSTAICGHLSLKLHWSAVICGFQADPLLQFTNECNSEIIILPSFRSSRVRLRQSIRPFVCGNVPWPHANRRDVQIPTYSYFVLLLVCYSGLAADYAGHLNRVSVDKIVVAKGWKFVGKNCSKRLEFFAATG